jgi:hypothetical protein
MIHTTKNLTLLVVFLLVLVPNGVTEDDQKLQLEMELSKSTYLVGEPIWLDATLTNVSSDTVRIFGFFPPCQGHWFNIELKDQQGNVVPYSGPDYHVVIGEGWIIEPQEHYYGCYNLLELFNTKRSLYSFFWQILPPGSYKVRASYENICSQEIEFQVVEPKGDEKEAYQLFESAKTLMMQKEFDLERQKLQELVNRFPQSAYAEKAHKELGQEKELLLKYPNSGYNGVNLKSLTRELASEQKQEFLGNVIRDHPETRSAKFARQMLARPELVGK